MYQLNQNGSVTRISDGLNIPARDGNADYQDVLAWVALGNVLQPADSASLEDLKAGKNADINAWRLAANFTTFPYAGKFFSCDQLSRSDIDGTNGAMTLTNNLPPNWPGGWKAVDNTYIPITNRVEWEAFYLAMCAYGAVNFAHSQTLKAALAAATTAEEVAAIVW